MVLVLTADDVKSVLSMKSTIETIEEAFKQYALGKIDMPLRTVIRVPKYKGFVNFMPAYLEGMDALGIKIVSAYPDNPVNHNLPTIMGTICLNDNKTGALTAIMDGAFITAMRTGAVGGVAAKYLARKDAKVVGVFGTGVQAKTQIMAVNEVRRIESAKTYSVDPLETRTKFCEEMKKELGIQVTLADSAEEVVKGSDIIITATTSKNPVFKGEWLDEGTHINGIGSHHGPGVRELDEISVKKAKVVVDSREACLKEAGDLIDPISQGVISKDHIYAELGEILIGRKKGRTNEKEITLFKSVGLALQDVSTAMNVYQMAKNQGVGKTISI